LREERGSLRTREIGNLNSAKEVKTGKEKGTHTISQNNNPKKPQKKPRHPPKKKQKHKNPPHKPKPKKKHPTHPKTPNKTKKQTPRKKKATGRFDSEEELMEFE